MPPPLSLVSLGNKNRPSITPVMNPPRCPSTSIFYPPETEERLSNSEMIRKKIILNLLSVSNLRKFQFKIKKERYDPIKPYTAVDAPTLNTSEHTVENSIPPNLTVISNLQDLPRTEIQERKLPWTDVRLKRGANHNLSHNVAA